MKPPARAIVGELIWSADQGVWALWRVDPIAFAHTAVADKLSVHAHIRGLIMSLPTESMLLSVCERVDPWDVAQRMADGLDLTHRTAWRQVCESTAHGLDDTPLHRRRYYVAALLPSSQQGWQDSVREALAGLTAGWGLPPKPVPPRELELRRRQADELRARLSSHVPLQPATTGEVCWLYARALQREIDEPPLDAHWEPPEPPSGARPRQQGMLAQLCDAVVKEGGYPDDDDRPRHRRYVRVDHASGTAFQTVLAMADMPHRFGFPGGNGEWLFHADQVAFPIDWCVRIRSVPNLDAQSKVRRKQRDLVGQIGEYDGEVSGAPPQLMDAISSIDEERAALAANPAEPELHVTTLLSLAAPTIAELEEQASTLTALFEPQEFGLVRPTGGQLALLRSMLPGTAAAPVCRDYTQFMLPRDLAAGGPFCGAEVGDPRGLLLGVSLDGGTATPVLFDPAYGPQVNASPSLAAVGRLGAGKSYLLKRLCWDTVARGGQVVTIDRTARGEYVAFGESIPGDVQVVRLEAGAGICLDPLRSFVGDLKVTVTLGFLSLLAGCSANSDEGAALAEAVDNIATRPGACLGDVVEELTRMGDDPRRPDPPARSLARRLAHYQRSATGQLAFGSGRPVSLEADFIVFWAPGLALPDRETLQNEYRARMMLPEQVLSQALLYLVAAVGRQVVFRDPSRFAAALYDEAWALLASPFGQNLLIEGVRDGRKHNGAIWLASQHPDDFAVSELEDLLGARFVFRQSRGAIPSALRFLGVSDSIDAASVLEHGLGNGQTLYRDVRDRTGLVQVLPPALPGVRAAFETSPSGGAVAPAQPVAEGVARIERPGAARRGTERPVDLLARGEEAAPRPALDRPPRGDVAAPAPALDPPPSPPHPSPSHPTAPRPALDQPPQPIALGSTAAPASTGPTPWDAPESPPEAGPQPGTVPSSIEPPAGTLPPPATPIPSSIEPPGNADLPPAEPPAHTGRAPRPPAARAAEPADVPAGSRTDTGSGTARQQASPDPSGGTTDVRAARARARQRRRSPLARALDERRPT